MARATRYGIDGWPYLAGFGTATLALGAAGVATRHRPPLGLGLLAGAAACAVPTALGTRYVTHGKFALRDRLLDTWDWRGDETVVDLGAGTGLLALGALHRTRGRAHAVDLFIGRDLSRNSSHVLRANADAEGVRDRLVVHRRDVRDTGLPTGHADVVVSSLCLHNLAARADREAALSEAVRLLAPGGGLLLSDLAHVDDEYAPFLRSRGVTVLRTAGVPGTFPRQRLLVARAPTGSTP